MLALVRLPYALTSAMCFQRARGETAVPRGPGAHSQGLHGDGQAHLNAPEHPHAQRHHPPSVPAAAHSGAGSVCHNQLPGSAGWAQGEGNSGGCKVEMECLCRRKQSRFVLIASFRWSLAACLASIRVELHQHIDRYCLHIYDMCCCSLFGCNICQLHQCGRVRSFSI